MPSAKEILGGIFISKSYELFNILQKIDKILEW